MKLLEHSVLLRLQELRYVSSKICIVLPFHCGVRQSFRVENIAVFIVTRVFYEPAALLKGITEFLHSFLPGTSCRDC